jgi:mannan endo-1,4-beta-mannosidase
MTKEESRLETGAGVSSSLHPAASLTCFAALQRLLLLVLWATSWPLQAAANEAGADRTDRLMRFAEICFPTLFPAGSQTASFAPFRYRYYPSTGVYLGLVTESVPGFTVDDVYVMGGAMGDTQQRVGKATDFITDQPVQGFVARDGRRFVLDGKTYRVAGANAVQMIANGDRSFTDTALCNARLMGANVVRFFGGSEIGSADGSVRTLGENPAWRPYFQSWDPVGQKPIYNQGSHGLQHLDYVVATAKTLGLRLIIALVDNWEIFFGGVNQYVLWHGRTDHGDFYTDPRIRKTYKDWITHLLNRTNTLTGVRYGDEPAIMAWTLNSEASCYGGESFPFGNCRRQDIEDWAMEMSAHVRSLAPRQLIGLGDQGYFASRADPAMGWPYRSTNEPDFDTVMRMPNIDFGTYHTYPLDFAMGNGSLTPIDYGLRYIRDHEAVSRSTAKPAILAEFGARDERTHAQAFDAWLSTLDAEGGAGFIFWGIGSRLSTGESWDVQGYMIFPQSPGAQVLQHWLRRFAGAAPASPR